MCDIHKAKGDHADKLLTQAEKAIARAFKTYIDSCRAIDVEATLASGGLNAVLIAMDLPAVKFAAAWTQIFAAIGTKEAEHIQLVAKAKATVSGVFDIGDPDAAKLMQRNKLNLITNLVQQQRNATRRALTRGLQEGLGTKEVARLFRNSIGLDEPRQRQLDTFAASQRAQRTEDMLVAEADRPPISSDSHINRLVDRKQQQLLQQRAEFIIRTESLKITSTARDEALRQSASAVGQSLQLIGVEWIATSDARTRPAHAERDGVRLRLGDSFVPGVTKPGEGGPAEVINCRCSVAYEMFDSEDELQRWLDGSSS